MVVGIWWFVGVGCGVWGPGCFAGRRSVLNHFDIWELLVQICSTLYYALLLICSLGRYWTIFALWSRWGLQDKIPCCRGCSFRLIINIGLGSGVRLVLFLNVGWE